jgi:predicted TIM-barrel enzyme
VEKIARMKEAIGTHPLAIASGITPENVEQYLPIANCFLVATGISSDFTTLDPSRVRDLVGRVRDYGKNGKSTGENQAIPRK